MMEVSETDYIELKCYIKYNLYYGQNPAEIGKILLQSGWARQIIEKAFSEAKMEPLVPQNGKKKVSAIGKFVRHEPLEAIMPPPMQE